MNPLKYLVVFCFVGFFSCDPPIVKNCPYDGIYTEECPCNDNMYRWQSYCYPKYENEIIFIGESSKHECLKEFLVNHNKFYPMSQFTLTKYSGGIPIAVNFYKKDDDGIFTQLLEGECKDNSLPAFQIKYLTQDINDKTETIKAKIYWWNIENGTYYDDEEDIELKKFMY
ncbi:MAG: hypothetical protein H6567_08860 [Lewinellaceae bacterium]|nr:hypothetical protein [Lewinellaceae bacterium]